MKPATASVDNGALSVQKTISDRKVSRYESALRARNITTLGARSSRFHEKCGLEISTDSFTDNAVAHDGVSNLAGVGERLRSICSSQDAQPIP
jgi:hypothetical protein